MARRTAVCLVVALAACGGHKSSAKHIQIAAAADLALAFEEVGKAFEARTGIHPTFSFGSTGLLAKQVSEGAPFDLFAAANLEFVDKVVAAGACDGATKTAYARGRIVVWTTGPAPARLEDLADPKYKQIAIANPDHAPYGRAAKQALEKVGIWDQVEGRIVQGENVQQALQYAQSGNVDAAIVALSLSTISKGGSSLPIDPGLYEPLDQAMVVCGKGPGTASAAAFAAFVGSPEGREIMNRYGFLLPGEQAVAPPDRTGGDRR
jgi:molybdate transport system substrate-binding protein